MDTFIEVFIGSWEIKMDFDQLWDQISRVNVNNLKVSKSMRVKSGRDTHHNRKMGDKRDSGRSKGE